jgi:hypothetical protein
MPPAETEPGRTHGDRGLERRVAIWAGVLVASVMLLVSSGTITGSDGPAMYQVARSIVEDGDLTVPSRLGFPGREGHPYAAHGLGLPLVALAPYLVARPVALLVGRSTEVTEAAVASLMPIVGGLLVMTLYALARRLGARVGPALIVAVGAAGGTYLLPYLKDLYSEPLATLLVIVAIERVVARRPGAAGLAAAAAGLTRPQTFALAPVLLWRLWRDGGAGAAVRGTAPLAVGAVISLGYNFVRFEDPLRFDPLQASIDPWPGSMEAVSGLLLLPTKSVLLFAPIVLVVVPAIWDLRSRWPTAFWLLGGNLVITFAVAVLWPAWDGGWTWGPRLLLPGLIPAVAPVARWMADSDLRRRAVVALLVLGFLISLPGVMMSTRAQLLRNPPPRGPSVLRQYALIPGGVRFTAEHLYERRDPRRYLDLWHVGLAREAGSPGLRLGFALSMPLLVGVGLSAFRLARRRHGALLRDQPTSLGQEKG